MSKPPLTLAGIDHVAFPVDDMSKALAFIMMCRATPFRRSAESKFERAMR